MNYDIGNQKWNESLSYRLFVSSMAHVRWLVYRRRHHSPKGALDVKLLLDRLRQLSQDDIEVDYVTELVPVSDFVGMSVQELRYLADVGEWIDLDRRTREMEDAEYEEFWQVNEVLLLNQLFYQ